jgi:hypothetical protein
MLVLLYSTLDSSFQQFDALHSQVYPMSGYTCCMLLAANVAAVMTTNVATNDKLPRIAHLAMAASCSISFEFAKLILPIVSLAQNMGYKWEELDVM